LKELSRASYPIKEKKEGYEEDKFFGGEFAFMQNYLSKEFCYQ
jgi:hypothetical protein